MCAAIWSTTPQQMRDYPMRSFLRFFTSHGLLQLANRPEWRTVQGGSRAYVSALLDDMGHRISVRSAARRVVRQAGLSIVEDRDGRGEVYTDVVIAAHADEALALLAEPSAEERAILGAFKYTPNTAILHDDVALMPKRRSVWSSWNYIGVDDVEADRPLCVSYWMNALQQLPTKRQLFVTLNPIQPPKVRERDPVVQLHASAVRCRRPRGAGPALAAAGRAQHVVLRQLLWLRFPRGCAAVGPRCRGRARRKPALGRDAAPASPLRPLLQAAE